MTAAPPRRTIRAAVFAVLATGFASAPAHSTPAPRLFESYFETMFAQPAGSSWYPTAGDLDLDGRDDVVRVNDKAGVVSLLIRFGEPDGRLSPTPLSLPLSAPCDAYVYCCIDDADGDGNRDIVIGAYSEIVVIRGLGGRTFAPAVSLPYAATGYVSAGDVNGDNIPDLALADNSTVPARARILFGTGGLAFTAGPDFPTAAWPQGAHLVDLDGDLLLDVLVGASGTSTALINQGSGSFVAMDLTGSFAFPAGDLDDDGFEDVLATEGACLGAGDGTFGAPIANGLSEPNCTADLDEDGVLDLIGLEPISGGHRVAVLRGLGQGMFAPESLYVSLAGTDAVARGDFDQDGHTDLFLCGYNFGTDAVLFGRGDGSFERPSGTFSTGFVPGAIGLGNLGPDSHPDIVLLGNLKLAVMLSQGEMNYAAPVVTPTAVTPTRIRLGDLNNDGLDDVVACYIGASNMSVWLTQAGGTLGPQTDFATIAPSRLFRLGFVDNDATLDIVSANEVSPNLGWWRHGNGDGTFGATNPLPASLGQSIEVLDLDHNGAADIVSVSPVSGGARVMLASSPGVFPSFTDYAGFAAGVFAGTGFFDPDTVRDVVVYSDSVWLYRGLGGGTFAARTSLGTGPGAFVERNLVCDLNGDGLSDILGSSNQAVAVCLGTGGRLPSRIGYGLSSTMAGCAVADVDGDGDADLAAIEVNAPLVTILLNQTITPNVGVPPAALSAIRMGIRAIPNPMRGRVTLELMAPGEGPVVVEMFDLAGRRVGSQVFSALASRTRQVSLAGGGELPAGLYLVRARQGAESASARVCLVH